MLVMTVLLSFCCLMIEARHNELNGTIQLIFAIFHVSQLINQNLLIINKVETVKSQSNTSKESTLWRSDT